MADTRPGVLRRALSRLTSTDQELEAAELRVDAVRQGATTVDQLPERERVCVCGTVRAVTVRPRAGVPALEAELYDGTGSVSIVWIGRRHVPGIEPGRGLVAHGRVTTTDGRRVIFNPRYELRSAGEA